ncbi:uncharacterized protein (DUF983 family) [Nitrospirillum pindoramense]|uniref:Uncharacterized protein (DUF983 family) n=1 Tax=Nitrospirillum amazonense TaxID=28077 RepID=A0A560GW57_9PROT|nr:uncharacterized protein (DUF983 family) [Nitrospirillum amazonense]
MTTDPVPPDNPVRVTPRPSVAGEREDALTDTQEEIVAPPKGMVGTAMMRGMRRCCPNCGAHTLFVGYTKVAPVCTNCGLETGNFRADDAPPYFTIFVVGHIVVGAALAVEQNFHPPLWVHAALWGPLTLGLSLALLPLFKGAVIGVQWAMGIRG